MKVRTRAGLAYLAVAVLLLAAGAGLVWLFGSDSAVGVCSSIPFGLGVYFAFWGMATLCGRGGWRESERPVNGGGS